MTWILGLLIIMDLYPRAETTPHLHTRVADIITSVPTGTLERIRSMTKDRRIHIVPHLHETILQLPRKYRTLIVDDLLPVAFRYFESTLMVHRERFSMKLRPRCRGGVYYLKQDELTGITMPFCHQACDTTVCGPVKVPQQYLDDCRVCESGGRRCWTQPREGGDAPALEADFLFFVSAVETDKCARNDVLAYAACCQQDLALDRPIAGYINICPGKISSQESSRRLLLATIKHEIFHALGFSAGLFAFFRSPNGEPLTPRDSRGLPTMNTTTQTFITGPNVLRVVSRPGWAIKGSFISHTVTMVTTPRVVAAVREHFGCADLEGGELENQGGDGTESTHWEKRTFDNEAMTGVFTHNPAFSRITLALMEDTGWYGVNYSMADPFDYGRSLGCEFVKQSCRSWMLQRRKQGALLSPYCVTLKSSPLHTKCTSQLDALVICNLVRHNSLLLPSFRYFDRVGNVSVADIDFYGGDIELADFCPTLQLFTMHRKSGSSRGTVCADPTNAPDHDDNFGLEEYGPGSRCVEHAQHWVATKASLVRTMVDWGSGCYRYRCLAGTVELQVNDQVVRCSRVNEQVNVTASLDDWTVRGFLKCPPCL